MNKLLPCPFCANKEIGITHNSDIIVTAYCKTCGSRIYGNSECNVIEKWNTRISAK